MMMMLRCYRLRWVFATNFGCVYCVVFCNGCCCEILTPIFSTLAGPHGVLNLVNLVSRPPEGGSESYGPHFHHEITCCSSSTMALDGRDLANARSLWWTLVKEISSAHEIYWYGAFGTGKYCLYSKTLFSSGNNVVYDRLFTGYLKGYALKYLAGYIFYCKQQLVGCWLLICNEENQRVCM